MSNRVTRGKVISLIAGFPFAVAAMTAVASADDDSGGTKAQFNYQDTPGPKGETCLNCTLFKAPAGCSAVKGKISPKGYCTIYVAKPKSN